MQTYISIPNITFSIVPLKQMVCMQIQRKLPITIYILSWLWKQVRQLDYVDSSILSIRGLFDGFYDKRTESNSPTGIWQWQGIIIKWPFGITWQTIDNLDFYLWLKTYCGLWRIQRKSSLFPLSYVPNIFTLKIVVY